MNNCREERKYRRGERRGRKKFYVHLRKCVNKEWWVEASRPAVRTKRTKRKEKGRGVTDIVTQENR